MSSSGEQKKMRSALIVGASGAVGKEVVKELVASKAFNKITSIGRRVVDFKITSDHSLEPELKQEIKTSDTKVYNGCELRQVIVDFENLDQHKGEFNNIDHVFCCLGTTRAQAGSAEAFKKVDYTYVVNSGEFAKQANVPHYSLVSSIGADPNSSLLYPQTKGLTEEKLKSFGFSRLSIFQPSFLKERDGQRFGEKVAITIYPAFGWFLPENYKPISTRTVAKAMVRDALNDKPGVSLYSSSQTAELGKD